MCQSEWRRARVQAQRLAEFARLRRVRDRIDREYAQPLNVEALARDANMPAGQLSRQFRAAYGQSPYAYLTARRIERAARTGQESRSPGRSAASSVMVTHNPSTRSRT